MNPSEFHARRRFAETPVGRVAYVEQGTGSATLFLHGLPLCGYQWREVMQDLAATRRCIALDQMGLGYTEVDPGQDLSFAGQARMVEAFLDALDLERVDLVGNDTGAGVSQIVAATAPGRVRSLTLTNCEVHDRWPNELLTGFYQAVESGAIAQAMTAMLDDNALAREQLGALVYEDPAFFTAERVKLYLGPLVASDERTALFRKLADWATNRRQLVDAGRALQASRIPAQVIWGDADPVFDMRPSLDWLGRNLGGLVKTTVVPRGMLFFPEEHPRLASVLMSEFWRALEERGATAVFN